MFGRRLGGRDRGLRFRLLDGGRSRCVGEHLVRLGDLLGAGCPNASEQVVDVDRRRLGFLVRGLFDHDDHFLDLFDRVGHRFDFGHRLRLRFTFRFGFGHRLRLRLRLTLRLTLGFGHRHRFRFAFWLSRCGLADEAHLLELG